MMFRKFGQMAAEAEARKRESTRVQALFQACQPPGWACPRGQQGRHQHEMAGMA